MDKTASNSETTTLLIAASLAAGMGIAYQDAEGWTERTHWCFVILALNIAVWLLARTITKRFNPAKES